MIKKHANTSMDISDGLFADIEKMINKQKLSYEININEIPVSKKLNRLISNEKILLQNVISRGDDYQILFTANNKKSRIIKRASKKLNIKVTKIGKIVSEHKGPIIIDKKHNKIRLNYAGFEHQF